jgi:hypothetical protein
MTPAQLAKMREQSNAGHKTPQTNLTIRTSNAVGDPWLAPRFSNPFAGKFWTDMMDWAKHLMMIHIASPWRIRSVANQFKLPKITRRDIRKAALETYIKYNQTLSTFQLSNMTGYVSDSTIKDLRTKYGKTVLPPGTKPVWEHQGLSISILNNAVLQAPAPLNLHFIQATVRIKGQAKFAVFDSTGKVILGKDEFKPVEDTWVIEKILERPESPWIIVSTNLQHPDDVAAAEAPAQKL